MRIGDALGFLRKSVPPVSTRSVTERAIDAAPVPSVGKVVRSGVVAGASVVALAAASALASAVRRRTEA